MWTMAKRSGVKGAPSFTVGRSFMVTWSGEVMFGYLLMFKIMMMMMVMIIGEDGEPSQKIIHGASFRSARSCLFLSLFTISL